MNYSAVETGAVILAVIVFVVYRQLRPRMVRDNPYTVPLVLAVIGLVEARGSLSAHAAVRIGDVMGVIVGLAFAAAVAVPRARSMTIFRRSDGAWMRRGNIRTLGWWFVSAAGHVVTALGVPLLFGERGSLSSGLERSTLLIYLAVTLGAQYVILHKRIESAHIVKERTSSIGDRPGSTPRHP